ncbi:Phage protein D [Nannocystis exedens]|uniref:Phage protein D n=1 Tax=Nannocystis exedens TaxID=54 RepID=A0A1I2FXC7_9BACT|nr:hypothetical protein [Nannocystis exedens]PCC73776.1 Phage late control gene D protein (GPD) [Nannocystis exedens]SFF09350.1 Phage protein D [Nannocystis exedens]
MADTLFYQVLVTSGGASYDLSRDLASFTWEQDDTRPDQLTLLVPDGHKVFSHALQEGMKVELSFGTDVEHAVVFRGRIYGVDMVVPRAGAPELTIRALDRSAEMGTHRVTRRWDEKPLSTVVKDVLAPYAFADPAIEIVPDPDVKAVQEGTTDLKFLSQLCDEYGCVLYVEQRPSDERVHFVGKAQIVQSEPELQLYHGRCGVPDVLDEFDATVDARRAEIPYVLTGVDRKTGKPLDPITVEPRSPGVVDDPFLAENLAAIADPTKRALLQQLIDAAPTAAAELRKLRLAEDGVEHDRSKPALTTTAELRLKADNWVSTHALGMSATGASAGLPRLRARTLVELLDVGGRFSGRWYVSRVKHSVGLGGYRTEFDCRR